MDFLPLGALLAILIAFLAWKTGHLTADGALAAWFVGTLTFSFGGLALTIALLAFFITSSLLSRLSARRAARVHANYAKTGRRDALQVLANGGFFTLFVLLGWLLAGRTWPWLAAAGALAGATADTWATELGALSPGQPRLITSGLPVSAGTSGAISLPGTLAAAAGALFIALLLSLVSSLRLTSPTLTPLLPLGADLAFARTAPSLLFPAVTLGGLLGSLVDSFLGATRQAIFFCPACARETERHPLHTCGTPTHLRRGWHWLNNDAVNAVCTLSAAWLAALPLLVL